MLAFGLIILGIISRCIIHVPNFTPVIAVAIFSGAYLNKKYSAFVPVALMMLSDIVIGFYDTMLVTWLTILLCSLMGFYIRDNKSPLRIFTVSLIASVFFFLMTNFATWLAGQLYPRTLEGLKDCFILAIPFFRPTLLSTLLYSAILFGVYEFIAPRVRQTRWATVLLRS